MAAISAVYLVPIMHYNINILTAAGETVLWVGGKTNGEDIFRYQLARNQKTCEGFDFQE